MYGLKVSLQEDVPGCSEALSVPKVLAQDAFSQFEKYRLSQYCCSSCL